MPGHDEPEDITLAPSWIESGLSFYPATRDGSGTSWIPQASSSHAPDHQGMHGDIGGWMLMGHAMIDGVYSWQDGPRGDEKTFVGGMLMGTAQRKFESGGKLQFRGMASPDPFMGKRGYPLLLASGETADGRRFVRDGAQTAAAGGVPCHRRGDERQRSGLPRYL
jgi:hypothetical protein